MKKMTDKQAHAYSLKLGKAISEYFADHPSIKMEYSYGQFTFVAPNGKCEFFHLAETIHRSFGGPLSLEEVIVMVHERLHLDINAPV